MKATATATVRRPIDEVWAFVTAPENMDLWVTGVSAARRTSEGASVGATFASLYTYGGKTREFTYEVTACDPPRLCVFASISGPFPVERTIALDPSDEVSGVTVTVDAGSDSRLTTLSFIFFGPLLRLLMRRQLRNELARLDAAITAAATPRRQSG